MSSRNELTSSLENTQRLAEQSQALQQVWTTLLGAPAPHKQQFMVWLLDSDYETVASTLLVTLRWLNRQKEPDRITKERKIGYVSGILKKIRFDKMSPEERAEKLSEIRAAAGRLGAYRKWQKEKRAICQTLPGVAEICSCSSDSKSVSQSDSDSDSQAGSDSDARPQSEPGDHKAEEEQQQEQTPKLTSSFSPLRLTDQEQTDQEQKPSAMKSKSETIGEHFAGDLTIELLTDGELDMHSDDTWSDRDWERLLGCAEEAVAAKSSLPFRGRKTCAQVMGDAMKRLRDEHREKAPRCWVPAMKTLRETAGPCVNLTVSQKEPVTTSYCERGTPGRQQNAWHKEHGFELCSDDIFRSAVDRESFGFTVKNADGVWQKAG